MASQITLVNVNHFFKAFVKELVWVSRTNDDNFSLAKALLNINQSGRFYCNVVKNESYGVNLLNTLVNNCHGEATLLFATFLMTGELSCLSIDVDAGVKLLKESFKLDNYVKSGLALAQIYESGLHGIEMSNNLAKVYYKACADLGSSTAALEYGLLMEMESREEEALEYYMLSAQKGNHEAMFSVGEFYEEARGGLNKDDSEACHWYHSAVQEGDCDDSRAALERLNDVATILGITAQRIRRGSIVCMLGE